MAKVTVDSGPAANQTVVVAVAPVNNISVALASRGGPVALRASVTVDNAGAGANTCTLSIAKNAVAIVNATRTLVMVAASRGNVYIEAVDPVGVVGDIYTIRANVAAVVVPTLLLANECALTVEALSRDDSTVAGVGAAAA